MAFVYLAVGHGKRPDGTFDPGAVSEDGRWNEQKAGDIVVRAAAARLRKWGIKVHDEADSDDPNYIGSTARANELGVDLCVAVHHDWYRGIPRTFGFWHSSSAKGERATKTIVNTAAEYGFDIEPSWVRARDDLYILKNTDMPATLIECGVIGESDLDEPHELERMGEAIALGVARYLGVNVQTAGEDPERVEEEVDDATIARIAKAVTHEVLTHKVGVTDPVMVSGALVRGWVHAAKAREEIAELARAVEALVNDDRATAAEIVRLIGERLSEAVE